MNKRKPSRRRSKPRATTSDVLGTDKLGAAEQIAPRWRKHFAALAALRERMLIRQHETAKDASEEAPVLSTHIADAGTDSYDRDFALSLLSSEQDAVYQIEQAIDRIRHGTYGICELTGKPIEPERLIAVPWARFGAEAERELESQGRRKRTRFGALDTVAKADGAESGEEEVKESETTV
jgi:RNA polymerase-binding transcription factor DksA